MTMVRKMIARFAADEAGAVTVDWVVLTAGVVAFGVMVVASITGNMGTIGSNVNAFLSSQTITTTF
jgi:Flp pilus assembly pilin Flp